MQELIYLDVTFCPVNHFITKNAQSVLLFVFSAGFKLTPAHFKMLIEKKKHLIFD